MQNKKEWTEVVYRHPYYADGTDWLQGGSVHLPAGMHIDKAAAPKANHQCHPRELRGRTSQATNVPLLDPSVA